MNRVREGYKYIYIYREREKGRRKGSASSKAVLPQVVEGRLYNTTHIRERSRGLRQAGGRGGTMHPCLTEHVIYRREGAKKEMTSRRGERGGVGKGRNKCT